MNNATTPQAKSNRMTIIGLALVFAAPILAAWYFTGGDTGDRGSIVLGELISPARPLQNLPLLDAGGQAFDHASLLGHWTLLTIDSNDCDEACQYNLDKITQVRQAMGEKMNRVERLLILRDGPPTPAFSEILARHTGLPVTTIKAGAAAQLGAQFRTAADETGLGQAIYIIDPLGNLMMRYRAGAEPRELIKDLMRLLKASHIG